MELWFVLALLAVVLWGSDGIFAKLSTPKIGVSRVTVLIAVVDGMVYLLGFLILRDNVPIGLWDAAFATVSCFIGTLAYVFYFEAIVDGQIAVVGTISAAYPALTVVGALLFLSETLTIGQALALVAIVGGVIALSYEPNPHSKHAMPRRSLFFALLAFALWGFWSLTSKMAIDIVGPGNILAFYVISSMSMPLVYRLLRRVRPRQLKALNPVRSDWAMCAIALALNVVGVFAFSFALEAGLASLVVPISSAYPVVTVILAVALLHERLDKVHLVALTFVTVGLIAISFTT